ncbi:MAG: hypothetical protein A6F71_10625, partial [Cycloclasticus sp. symbiont of Poecilosclerida sp. M]
PPWVKQGEALHKQQTQIFKHRSLKRFGLQQVAEQVFNVFVSSEALQLHGVVDSLLICADTIYPIEFKLSGHKPSRGQILQLTAYGMLAEDKYKRLFRKGFILYEQKGKTMPIIVQPKHRQQVLNLRDKILDDLEQACLPDSPATPAQCTQCEYLNYCNDRN